MTRRELWAGLAVLAFAAMAATKAGAAPQAPADVMVDVRGHQLHFRVYRGGRDTLLLESGSGLGAAVWDDLAPRLAAATRATVISYDRAGMGLSDGLDTPYDVHEEIGRLHAGLHALRRHERLVLIGHSYGGYLIQLYSNLYPEAVRGLVYVDANTVTGIDGLGGANAIATARIALNDVPNPTKVQRANLRLSRGLEATQETMRRYPIVCGIPVVVITAGKVSEGFASGGVEAWRRGHEELVRLSGGTHLFAERSGHMVPHDQPDIIIEAASEVLSKASHRGATLRAPGAACSE